MEDFEARTVSEFVECLAYYNFALASPSYSLWLIEIKIYFKKINQNI